MTDPKIPVSEVSQRAAKLYVQGVQEVAGVLGVGNKIPDAILLSIKSDANRQAEAENASPKNAVEIGH